MKKIIKKIQSQGKEQLDKTIRIMAFVTTGVIVVIWLVLTHFFQKKEPVNPDPTFQEIQQSFNSFQQEIDNNFDGVETQLINQESLFEVSETENLLPLETILEDSGVSDTETNPETLSTNTSINF